MPVAKDFFGTYNNLEISTNLWVKVGRIVNYVRDTRGIQPEDFSSFNIDIELLHSEIEEKLREALSSKKQTDAVMLLGLYNEMIFLFSSVLNEVQNGPVSPSHLNLVNRLTSQDCILTFNWDTLIDRALAETTSWKIDFGYAISPVKVYRNGWIDPLRSADVNAPILLKLHGSTNWLTGVTVFDLEGNIVHSHSSTSDSVYVYESTTDSYDCYDGRYMAGYEPFSYGYYPPNLPDKGRKLPDGYVVVSAIQRNPFTPKGTSGSKGITSMQLIIPPVRNKSYDFFGELFKNLWQRAVTALAEADEIHIYGYSFPPTDVQSNELFRRAFMKRTTMPSITIINPSFENIRNMLHIELGIPLDKIRVVPDYINESYSFDGLL
jgi:hypothetical protein